MPQTEEPILSQEEFVMIRDFIHEKSGMYFADNKKYLIKNRLTKRLAALGMKNFKDYFYHVKYDTTQKEFNELMNLVTTNETSFFRNEPQLLSFSDEVLPLLIDEKEKEGRHKTLRIWSAGCSTGEEPYTLAVMILEKLKSRIGWNVEIIANDISEQVLHTARLGEYSGLTLRNIRPDMLSRYFTKEGDSFRVNKEVKALVKFAQMNLNDQKKFSINRDVDIIFCRNVMIYFSDEVRRGIIRGFYNSLRPGGYFYIGHSETLHGVSKAFKLVYFKNALVYQKEKVGAAASASPAGAAALRSTVTFAGASSGASRAMDLLSKIKPMTVKK